MNKHLKDAKHFHSIREKQIKPQRDLTACLLEWAKLERQTIPSGGKDMKELELSYTAAENMKWDKIQPL